MNIVKTIKDGKKGSPSNSVLQKDHISKHRASRFCDMQNHSFEESLDAGGS
jgi:hypothetical protein